VRVSEASDGSARVEVNQQQEAKKREQEDLAGDVVAKLVDQTNVEPAGPQPGRRARWTQSRRDRWLR